jgi:two-component system, OmpR family, aerobic respiration control sensor histidine kinase ArcB
MSTNKRRILVIEDHLISTKCARIILEKQFDCEVDDATEGKQGVGMAINNHYDCIYMNIGLPTISGIEACQLIRQYEAANNLDPVPVIAVTASGNEEACLAAGMQGFIQKPFTKTDMLKFLSY